jgi:hypothetical protein
MEGDDRMAMTAEQRSLRARIGAYSLHAKVDPRSITEHAAERSFLGSNARLIVTVSFPNRKGHRRAEYARRAYFARLALASVRTRAARRTSQH